MATLSNDKKTITVQAVDVHRAKMLLEAGEAVLIDVRETIEYEDEHIPGAALFPLSDFDARRPEGDAGKIGIFHCRSGRRTAEHFGRFVDTGFREVVHMDGGIVDWSIAGYPVRTEDDEEAEEQAQPSGSKAASAESYR